MGQPPSDMTETNLSNPPRAMGDTPPNAPFYQLTPFSSDRRPGVPSILSPFSAIGGLPANNAALPLILENTPKTANEAEQSGELPEPLQGTLVRPLLPERAQIRNWPPLSLEETLASSERSYPLFLATLLDREQAQADVLSANGNFDLNLNADSRNWPLGYYNRTVQDVFLEQPLGRLGGEVFGGYRLATGNWPVYYNYLNTRRDGAFVAGLKIPLLKNRQIDARRAKLYQSEIEQQKVEPSILKERIKLRKEASKAYWDWVAAGQSYLVYKELVQLVEARFEGLRKLVPGLIRPIDLESYRLSVVTRRSQLIDARRRFQRASIELSMFLRDASSMPMIPEDDRLPLEFPTVIPPDAGRLNEDIEVALRLRPEILSLRLAARKGEIEQNYAQNQSLPSLSLYVYTEQNMGARVSQLGSDFRPFIMETSLLFDVPIQRRYARGRILAADTHLRQLALETRQAADRIRADVQDALTGVDACHQNLLQWREYHETTKRLEEAERAAIERGLSNLLNLIVREQSTADALAKRIEVEGKYLISIAEYHSALGVDSIPSDMSLSASLGSDHETSRPTSATE